ncbi:hypothetical protein CASFOL_013244 [Castilleja foliolosa]|uniref:F-box domain-containing protein n=1 Tax=Castilleja foliolosa TaxID=1961234 RepID=A0ABD3DNA9_9LAMI
MANSVLPEVLMLCILTRLPVKTIIRFKSVCKPWFHLFSTPEFKKLHQAQFSSDPKNQSFIVHTFDRQCSEPKNQFSIFNIESGQKRPTILDYPFDHAQNNELYIVGCCNGLFCIHSIHRGQDQIVLWNPAMKLSKTIPLKDLGPSEMRSLGFGYDAIGDDFKVVMILTNKDGDPFSVTSTEIYSVNLGSWITIDMGIQFSWYRAKDDLIVNGNPYWDGYVEGNKVLVCFDVLELVFKIVPLSTTYYGGYYELAETQWRDVKLVDWNGALGALIINFEFEEDVGPPGTKSCARVECFEVRVFDDIERIWRNKHTFGPIEVDVFRLLHCSTKNEKILGLTTFDKLIVLDLETGSVKELFDGASADASIGETFEVYGFTESLTYINGMENVVVKNEQNDIDD